MFGKKVSFQVSLTTLVLCIVLTVSAVFIWNGRRESTNAAKIMAAELFDRTNEGLLQRSGRLLDAVKNLADLGAGALGLGTVLHAGTLHVPLMNVMCDMLEQYDYFFSLYLGYANGDFVQLSALRTPDVRKGFSAPEEARYLLRIITTESGGRRTQWIYLNARQEKLFTRQSVGTTYDPRRRSWYVRAMQNNGAVFTDPYVFHSSGEPGITCAEKLESGAGVFGVDVTLTSFSQFLRELPVSEHGSVFFLDHLHRVMAHATEPVVQNTDASKSEKVALMSMDQFHDPIVRLIDTEMKRPDFSYDVPRLIVRNGREYLVNVFDVGSRIGLQMLIAVGAPLSDFTGHVARMQRQNLYFALGILLLVIPLVFYIARRVSHSLALLGKEADRVRRFDFTKAAPVNSHILEIDSLSQAFLLMKNTLHDYMKELMATQHKLQQLVEQGILLAAEHDLGQLMELTLEAAQQLTNADGGIVYFKEETGLRVRHARCGERTFSFAEPGEASTASEAGELFCPLREDDADRGALWHVVYAGKTEVLHTEDMLKNGGMLHLADVCPQMNAPGHSVILAPLKTRQNEILGVLQLENARDPDSGEVIRFYKELTGYVEALAAQTAVTMDNKHLVDVLSSLLDSFIKLLAGAIDAKSPYTGGHCSRVPEIAFMLARAASQARQGPFADFAFTTEDAWIEFHIAAWLHDCGKITIPEYVVDKATKLETLYNRIHEIRTRFEVLWRDAEILYYQKRLAGDADVEALRAELETAREQLRADYAFIAQCNAGGEAMTDADIARIRQIGAQTWLRHLDDGLGLSPEEEVQRKDTPREPLPVTETLLADKPEHRIRRRRDPLGNGNGQFKMQVPELLFNRGELHNLCVRKGTLTEEERFKIQEHIIQTIIMLEKLPFPKNLQRVPEYAGAHHETMIGTGYPRRLRKEQMSLPARIMAVADIFEALTAADRPYNRPKSLGVVLKIMSRMRDEQHIDPDIFDLLLTSGVYKEYAAKFMRPGQMEEVDILPLLSEQGRAGLAEGHGA